ncbi:MAG TPA: peptidase M16, partial [Gammaproteobacteria bacterium]|nr:peptidase M16 [Gammaproteobacteria bacterium]
MPLAIELNKHFIKLTENVVPSLSLTVETYEHKITGARHYHLASSNKENVFLVGLKTVPVNSRGVAHILEHTALCGSKNYPVRDPFFMMIRRSLNTFMNAFTSSDWTAYPFASQNKKDFSNLLDVYLDAVFFSNLDELDFAQEGHRLEFEETENANSPLVYKGVVYNEMKGAMSSPVSVLWQTFTENIFPTNTYHYNSGGDPQEIPDLSYAELKAFYQTHYHPSNAFFFTYGDIPAIEHQTRFHDKVLQHFDKSSANIDVAKETRYTSPKIIEDRYALAENESEEKKTHVVVGWLLGESADAETRLKATLLSSVLLDNGSSPLRYALENTKLGAAPSPLCGLEDSNREMIFMCGIEGANNEDSA